MSSILCALERPERQSVMIRSAPAKMFSSERLPMCVGLPAAKQHLCYTSSLWSSVCYKVGPRLRDSGFSDSNIVACASSFFRSTVQGGDNAVVPSFVA